MFGRVFLDQRREEAGGKGELFPGGRLKEALKKISAGLRLVGAMRPMLFWR
jgi:hypothetical protein